jgi:hypothetical protein
MFASSEPARVAGVAAGIADTERGGINTKAQTANPINESRFIIGISPDEAASSRQRGKFREGK